MTNINSYRIAKVQSNSNKFSFSGNSELTIEIAVRNANCPDENQIFRINKSSHPVFLKPAGKLNTIKSIFNSIGFGNGFKKSSNATAFDNLREMSKETRKDIEKGFYNFRIQG